jgi:hypothetical protein
MNLSIDTILEKAAQASQRLKDQKRAGFVLVLCLDQNRETQLVPYVDRDVEETREQLQELLDEGARPVCIQVLPLDKPIFVALSSELSLDDQAVIDSQMVKCEGAQGAILLYDPRPEDEGNDNG